MTSEALYFDSRSFFENLKRDVQSSQYSIDIEVYIWAGDSLANELFECLIEAVQRGVKVRLVVDGIGSLFWVRSQLQPNFDFIRGIEVHVFNPLNRLWAIHLWPKFNRRTHRKIFLIDNKILYTGSINVMNETLNWRETGLRLESPAVSVVQNVFDYTWRMTQSKFFRFFSGKRSELFRVLRNELTVRTNQFFRLRGYLRKDLVKKINSSNDRVWLITPYFNPPAKFLRALVKASRRGVDVRLVLPGQSDIFFAPWIGQLHYKLLLNCGIKIYEYSPCILHAKVSLIDDWCSLGSSNLNYRSFKNDLELDIVLALPESIEKIRGQFERDMQQSIKIESIAELAFWKRMLALLIFRFWRWM